MNRWMQQIILAWRLNRKIQSFTKLGYPTIQKNELLEYLTDYRWPRRKIISFKERLADLQQVLPNDFFDYQQLKIQTSQKTLPELDDFSDLF